MPAVKKAPAKKKAGRPNKMYWNLCRAIIDDGVPGEWYVLAEYRGVESATERAALIRQKKVPVPGGAKKWELTTERYKDGDIRSRLYARWLG
jgi:hypothetical protein